MTTDELARVTAERDAARDEVTRLDAELTGVRASLVEQADDAEDLRAVVAIRTEDLREAQALLAGYRQDLNERDAEVAALGRVEAVINSAKNSWWHTGGTRCTPVGPIRDALRRTASDEEVLAIAAENAERWAGALDLLAQAEAAERDAEGAGSTRDGSASPEDSGVSAGEGA